MSSLSSIFGPLGGGNPGGMLLGSRVVSSGSLGTCVALGTGTGAGGGGGTEALKTTGPAETVCKTGKTISAGGGL